MAALREIAQASGINGRNEVLVAQGFRAPAPKGRFEFGGILFEESENEGRFSFADPRDVARTVDSIKDALLTMDYVVVMVHSHEVKCASDEEADYFLEEFAHACIEAGASAVIGTRAGPSCIPWAILSSKTNMWKPCPRSSWSSMACP